MPYEHQRSYYRISYPGPARPVLDVDGQSFAVVDCSESGLRYELTGRDAFPPTGSTVRGTIRFKRGRELEIVGSVARHYGDTVALSLQGDGIPFGLILDEQQYLRRNFLRHLSGDERSGDEPDA